MDRHSRWVDRHSRLVDRHTDGWVDGDIGWWIAGCQVIGMVKKIGK